MSSGRPCSTAVCIRTAETVVCPLRAVQKESMNIRLQTPGNQTQYTKFTTACSSFTTAIRLTGGVCLEAFDFQIDAWMTHDFKTDWVEWSYSVYENVMNYRGWGAWEQCYHLKVVSLLKLNPPYKELRRWNLHRMFRGRTFENWLWLVSSSR